MSINIKFFIKKDNQWFYYKVLCDLSISNFVNFNGGKKIEGWYFPKLLVHV
jgi:hypothetical protein